jgi:glycosyltransferase involved in cell wall biosynthesis
VSPLRIAIVQPTFNSTTIGWVQGLERLGHEVLTITAKEPNSDPVGGIEGILGVDRGDIAVVSDHAWSTRIAKRLPGMKMGRRLALPRLGRLRSVLRRYRPDHVLIKEEGSLRASLVAVLALMLGIPRHLWVETTPTAIGRRIRVLRAVGVLPRHIFVTNDPRPGGLVLSAESLGMRRITYGAPIWPEEARDPRTGDAGREVVARILTIASFKNTRKRPWWTLEAAAAAGLIGDDSLRFTFVGAGHSSSSGYRRTSDLARRYGIETRVALHTGIPYAQMHKVIDAHDLLVLPCAQEPFGMSIVEALARGLAVIVPSDAGAVGCVLDGQTGAVFEADELSSLAARMAEVLDDRGRLARMGAAARAFSAEHLATDKVARELADWLVLRSD